mgnify:CR=1 FL=1
MRVLAEVAALARGIERRQHHAGAARQQHPDQRLDEGRAGRDEQPDALALEGPARAARVLTQRARDQSRAVPERGVRVDRPGGVDDSRARGAGEREPSLDEGRVHASRMANRAARDE